MRKIFDIIVAYRNQIYFFLFINYILLFLLKIEKLPFISYQSEKSITIAKYLLQLFATFRQTGNLSLAIFILAIVIYAGIIYLISDLIYRTLNSTFIQNHIIKINILKSEYLTVLFIFAFSLAVRLIFINAGLFHHDSFQMAIASEKLVNEFGLHGIGGGRHGVVLVNAFIFFIFKTFFGHNTAEFAVNFSSALFGALSVAVLYLLIKNLFNRVQIAFSASIMYAVTPIFLSVSTFAKEHTLDVFVSLLSLLVLVNGLRKKSYGLAFVSGLLLSMLIFVRIPSLLIAPSAIFLILIHKKIIDSSNLSRLKVIIYYFLPLLIVVLLYLLFSSSTLVNEAKSNFNPLTFGNLQNIVRNNFNYSLEGIVFSLTILGFLLSIAGFVLLLKENKVMFFFLILFFIPLFLFYTLSKTINHRFFSLPLVVLVVSMAYSVNFIKRKEYYLGILLFLLLSAIMFLNIYPVLKFRHEFSAFKELAKMVNENTHPSDSFVVLYGDDTIALNYYSKTPTRSCDYGSDADSINRFVAEINDLLEQNYKVFISGACFGLGNQEKQQQFLDFMDNNFRASVVAEYTSDDYHLGAIQPIIKRVSMLRLYGKNSLKSYNISELDINY